MTLKHQLAAAVVITMMSGPVLPAFAADPLMLRLEPHCADANRSQCRTFDISDADHLSTGIVHAGDIVDIDVVLLNGDRQNVQTVRSWLKYDPQILEARSVELTKALPEPTPGEQDIDAAGGFVKIGGTAQSDITSNRLALARVTFRVLGSTANTDIAFSNFREDGTGETAVNGGGTATHGLAAPPCIGNLLCQHDNTGNPLLLSHPSMLTVMLTQHAAAADTAVAADVMSSGAGSSAPAMQANGYMPLTAQNYQQASSSQSSVMQSSQSSQSSVSSAANGSSSFSLLQVQNVRVTSQDTSIFLGWQTLKSSELNGYNIYYGTVSGKYIQRRSIPSTASSLVIRDLQKGTTYYLAVRGFNQADQESIFSQEVSVEVGKPESSSAPLVGGINQDPLPDGNPIQKRGGKQINGTTGTGQDILYLAVFCALIGTAFAAHRQMTLSRSRA